MSDSAHAISREWISSFYREHHRALAAYAAALTRSRDEAEDLVHEALVGMLAVRGSIENPEAYAYRAIRNRAFDRLRRLPRREVLGFEAGRSIDGMGGSPADASDSSALQGALASLAPAAAEVVVLHARSGLSFPQIAVVLDEPVGTVSARYSRALAEMRVYLAKEEQHG
jgi:RNA polymerase sigma-70 factor (ECF subfamily)